MKAVKILLLVIIVLAAAVAIIGLILPGEYMVSRSQMIESNPTHVAAYVRNLDQWKHWSPWEECEPPMEITVGKQSNGVGATMSWTGEQGNGRLEVIAVTQDRVDFVCYFEDDMYFSDCSIRFEAVGDATNVTWTMAGIMDKPVIQGPYMALLVEGMTGPMFEKGLANLKAVAEKGPAQLSEEAKQAEAALAAEKEAEAARAKAAAEAEKKPLHGPATEKNKQ